ncbi:phage tail protein [Pontibacter qinzhouensis]|uniref:Phage tail protein n=1 Tax=Pontibacter qinzhouensis TaxID=2603253 RepID=A0A5C8K8W5_9BACT|nr:phage tail protein [Pontibacter qinzhouensis]TXK50297.1 phage tail protein [Pontibacter qinzhouensis]
MADALTPSAGGYYPPVGFHFLVEFQGIGNDNDVRFQSVSGLNVEFDTESFKEGGQNQYEHKLPVRAKFSDLVLKRGMLTDSELITWCTDALFNREFRPAQVIVKLLNPEHQPLKTWKVNRAWPRKWAVSDFNASENSVVVETLELSFSYFTVD